MERVRGEIEEREVEEEEEDEKGDHGANGETGSKIYYYFSLITCISYKTSWLCIIFLCKFALITLNA